ncbi:MAG TPA: YggS family pyridoxal phosphate-dependent enzyme [Gammaproteobacteria bacterium]|nr:YggS family pyridoxal phosphate-dependent enzyme [Gammaproteobacteria bacterium]
MAGSNTISENIRQIQLRLDSHVLQYHRQRNELRLLAVSKGHDAAALRQAYACGLREFGESYVQEAITKIQALSDLAITWHFIGAIQSNKTRDIALHFDWVHSIDRLKIAQRLSEQRPADKPPLQVCLQINISNEASKSGIALGELQKLATAVAKLPGLQLRGLMALPQASEDLNEQRQAFHQMHLAFRQLRSLGFMLDTLSMGMSGDMEAAIAEGSTLLRIGTAIFGERPAAH